MCTYTERYLQYNKKAFAEKKGSYNVYVYVSCESGVCKLSYCLKD